MWMIYGANGYTGELIAREAMKRGQRPILAGRSAEKVEPLARELALESRVFDVENPQLDGVQLVLHCAGPFIRTSRPMVDACLAAGAHYLDITGEIEVFEAVMARDAEAKQRGVSLLPGVGFDVVPTDCLAAMLKAKLPTATELWLAWYAPRAAVSPGTMKTMLEGAGYGGMIRRDGKLVRVPLMFDVREIPYSSGPRLSVTIPWGDVSTAFHSTGIPNIRVYTARSPKAVARLKRIAPLMTLLRFGPIRRYAQKVAEKRTGPDATLREAGRTYLWGRAFHASDEVTMTMETPEGYEFTVRSALAAVQRVLGEAVRPGAMTPSTRFGAEFVLAIPGVSL
ncbi:MAG TPA: saccharopine dehydrogenase NADP-binding domain-containing protein [Thermoanaerobaculia bacterium]|jgi:short subunit dehydrogenase-like uncharacterized protein